MAIEIQCACGRILEAPDEAAGKVGRCFACGAAVDIPLILFAAKAPAPMPTLYASATDRSVDTPATAAYPEAEFDDPNAPPIEDEAALDAATREVMDEDEEGDITQEMGEPRNTPGGAVFGKRLTETAGHAPNLVWWVVVALAVLGGLRLIAEMVD